MGNVQENWFHDQLSYSSKRAATWRIIGQQCVFSRLNESTLQGQKFPFDYVHTNSSVINQGIGCMGWIYKHQSMFLLGNVLTVETNFEPYCAKSNQQYDSPLRRFPC